MGVVSLEAYGWVESTHGPCYLVVLHMQICVQGSNGNGLEMLILLIDIWMRKLDIVPSFVKKDSQLVYVLNDDVDQCSCYSFFISFNVHISQSS